VIAVDGKTLRQSYRKGERTSKGALHMIQAWATSSGLVLGQGKSQGKSNEIKSIPRLLEILSLKGCIVTLDAMGCQKAIAEQIRAQDADYVLALKGNHGGLHEDVVQYFDYATRRTPHALHTVTTVDKGHGRVETRRYAVCGELGWLDQREDWCDLKSLVRVEAERWMDGNTHTEQRYYLSSLPPDAALHARAVRSHWGIENQLHDVLDVTCREDDSRIREGHAPQNMAIVRRMALNALKQEPTAMSIKKKCFKASINIGFLEHVITNGLLVR
jgi:predicted transposase YbfD/YdcC